MNLPRYKYVVQVVIGEQRGEGVRMGSRCFWDSETDNVASETFVNVRAPLRTVQPVSRGEIVDSITNVLTECLLLLLPLNFPCVSCTRREVRRCVDGACCEPHYQ